MQVRLRLQKTTSGAKHRYNYRVVAMPVARNRQGRALEILGHYDAAKDPAELKIDLEKVDKWLENGAQMSDTVAALVRKLRRESK